MRLQFHIGRRVPERTESESVQFGRDARRDWRAVCLAFFFVNLFLIAGSMFVYRKVNVGEIFLVDKKEPVSGAAFNRFELEKAVTFFEEKTKRFEALLEKPLMLSDPAARGKKKEKK